nr:NAD(P)H-dependent oxidoreductase [Mycobacteroides chelonae]
MRLAVICASTRDGRFGPTVANWIAEKARHHPSFHAGYIDLAEYPLPLHLSRRPGADDTAHLAKMTARLRIADAFLVVTPEYNHSFPAPLKNLIDWHHSEWQAKPVGFTSYGGMSGGLRAIEQLRLVFAELHAVTTRDVVSFHGVWSQFDDAGQLVDSRDAETAAKTMLDELAWWGSALRTAREHSPYAW